jgi:hypothetical protein
MKESSTPIACCFLLSGRRISTTLESNSKPRRVITYLYYSPHYFSIKAIPLLVWMHKRDGGALSIGVPKAQREEKASKKDWSGDGACGQAIVKSRDGRAYNGH